MSVKVQEPAFQGVGLKVGTEIWRIENSQPVPLPKSDYGRFYNGDSYIVLKTAGKAGAHTYDIHFWLGKDTSQDEAKTAAIKAVELDMILGGRAIQYRELEGHESVKFLSYFKPCVMPLEGGFASGFKTNEEEQSEPRLYTCKGKRIVRVKQVPFNRSSLNHDDVLILDTKDKIYQFNGANTNIHERSKALDVVQLFKERYHEGSCNVGIVEDGKLQSEGPSGEFWNFFGGFAPIGKKVASEDDIIPEKTPPKLHCYIGGRLQEIRGEGELSKTALHTNKCYLLYCGTELFIWVGKAAQLDDKKTVFQAAEDFIVNQNLPKWIPVIRLIQGHETNLFKSNFASWPTPSSSAPEEPRGKVAALLKQQGAVLKGQTKSSPVEEEVPPLLAENGKLEVWRIDGDGKTPLPKEDIGKFYAGDCYICHYSYHSNEKKEDHYLCCWIGKDSTQEDQKMVSKLTTSMFTSLKCKPVQGRIYQGKEPPQFVAIFQPLVVLKGGLSSAYKSYIAEKGVKDDTYSPDTAALIEVSGTSLHNNKALQVDIAATSLSSYSCFIQQSGSSVCTWYGNQSTVDQQQLAAKVVELLKSGVPVKFAKEGKESLAFWLALGGKQSYTSKKLVQEIVREPHLFAILSTKGKFEIEEVYNFEQDDLFSEDVMILDTHADVVVWVGQNAESKEKQNALETGQKYVDLAAVVDGLSPQVPLYRVPEGSEPSFFTKYFSWDHAKTNVQGNSFRKKAVLLFGPSCMSESQDKEKDKDKEDNKPQGGATQRASAMAALTNAFRSSTSTTSKTPAPPRMPTRGSQRAAAVAALSTVLMAEKKDKKAPTPPVSPPRRHHRRTSSSESVSSAILGKAKIFDQAAAAAAHKSEETAPVKNEEAAPVKSEEAGPVKSEEAGPVKNDEAGPVKSEEAGPVKSEEAAPAKSEESPVKSEEAPSNDNSETCEVTSVTGEPNVETHEEEASTKETADESNDVETGTTYTYDQLRSKSTNPVTGIDFKKRETYLSPEEFESIFHMTKEAFYELPRWKQDRQKKNVDLF